MTTNKLDTFCDSLKWTRKIRELLNGLDIDSHETELIEELFMIAVHRLVDDGHMLLMDWDRADEERDFERCMDDHTETERETKIKGWRKVKNKKSGEDYEYRN